MFKTPYDGSAVRVRKSFLNDEGEFIPGKTEQAHTKSCDLKRIMKQYDREGKLSLVNEVIDSYGDFTEVDEYQVMQQKVVNADSAFAQLPSEIRNKFDNDPGKFFEFATNPENLDKLREWKLADPKPLDHTTEKAVETAKETATETAETA